MECVVCWPINNLLEGMSGHHIRIMDLYMRGKKWARSEAKVMTSEAYENGPTVDKDEEANIKVPV